MRKLIFFSVFCFLFSVFCSFALANNLRVENAVFYKSADQPAGTIDVRFDVVWDNSSGLPGTDLQDANSQSYYDRAWIFVKFWDTTKMVPSSSYPWGHAILTTGGSLSTYNASTGTGLSPAEGMGSMGAFAACGTSQTVRWNYAATLIPGTANYVASTDTIKVRVMAIEMVRIPTGAFSVGDGTATTVTGQFSTAGATTPFYITSEGAITLGPGGLGNRSHAGMNTADDFTDTAAPATAPTNLPAAFPKGYQAFYIMKYDITQGQYRDFLNTLTRTQQSTRVASNITADVPASVYVYVMSASTGISYRNGIRCPTSGNGTVSPITFYCSLNGGVNGATDGEFIACNHLGWPDLIAYADWAGLRPMTELEYEKAARGTANPVANEYAWGSTSITASASGPTNSGANNEIATNNGNCLYIGGVQGPIRSGFAATSSSTRYSSGASFYGVMELSGNLWKRPVTVGNATGRSFTGLHGNGALDATGNADVSLWPGTGAAGSGYRGGYWDNVASFARVSDRTYAAYTVASRSYTFGARLARTSP